VKKLAPPGKFSAYATGHNNYDGCTIFKGRWQPKQRRKASETTFRNRTAARSAQQKSSGASGSRADT